MKTEKLTQVMVERKQSTSVKRWHEGLENHEKLKRLLPFMQEDEGYL